MSNFLDRLKIERDELKEKVDKLGEFIEESPQFSQFAKCEK